jgi:hypothetical protein
MSERKPMESPEIDAWEKAKSWKERWTDRWENGPATVAGQELARRARIWIGYGLPMYADLVVQAEQETWHAAIAATATTGVPLDTERLARDTETEGVMRSIAAHSSDTGTRFVARQWLDKYAAHPTSTETTRDSE